MPAVTTASTLALPRIDAPDPTSVARPVDRLVPAIRSLEGAGFLVWRPFPGGVDAHFADPFFLLDQMGPVEYAPYQAAGAPWHPHRGFETVTYMIDGEFAHHDSNGGGGIIREGDTQWMTAGAGILHDEMPTEEFLARGGLMHGVQLWVNLPAAKKFSPPRYQTIARERLTLLTSPDGGALVRLIAGNIGAHEGPGSTHTPITYAHVTLSPGARIEVPWSPDFNALVYVLQGRGDAGEERRPIGDHDLVRFGAGDHVVIGAAEHQATDVEALDVLVLGGLPIREPIEHYGPFLMNTREEIVQALDDYQSGRMGAIPAVDLADPAPTS